MTIYDRQADGWAWGQLSDDNYVGWIADSALRAPSTAPTHRVRAQLGFAYRSASIKTPPLATLPFGARLVVTGEDNGFAVTADGWFVPLQHIHPIESCRNGFRRRRRAVRRHALFVGREKRSGHRLLGTGAGRAARLRRGLPARQRYAASVLWVTLCRLSKRTACNAAIWCSGKVTSPSRAMTKRSFMPTRFTWRLRSSAPATLLHGSPPWAAPSWQSGACARACC